MVDKGEYTGTFIINRFKGLNERDPEDYLPKGDTPRGQNFEITTGRSLTSKDGTRPLYSTNAFKDSAFRAGAFHWGKREVPYYLTASNPKIELVSPVSGFGRVIYRDLKGMGEGAFISGEHGDSMFVDGSSSPVHISDTTATTISWPPVYTNQNKTVVNASPNATADNPTTLGQDIGYPSLGAYFEGRYVLAGDRLAPQRLYFSKIRSVDFQDNAGSGLINIAFFLDVDTNSPIVGVQVVNDKYLVVFCRHEMHILEGKFPPALVGPAPQMQIRQLNPDIGCIGRYAFVEKGDNDIFFISNKQMLYTLSSTDNFRDARPYGLSEKIYKSLRAISPKRMSRARLINDNNKGELQIWLPETDNDFYPNMRFIYNYGSDRNEAEWGKDIGFPISLRSAFVDKSINKVMLVDRQNILEDSSGSAYDTEDILLKYQISPIDFVEDGPSAKSAVRDMVKKVVESEITYTLEGTEEATLSIASAWDNGVPSGLVNVVLKPVNTVKFGDPEAKFGSFVYTSNAGNPINTAPFNIINDEGKILKLYLQCTVPNKLTIIDLKLRYKLLSKGRV